jgi:predicted dehydrogenase
LIGAVNFQLRYSPHVLAARSLIEAGVIGKLQDMEVRITVDTPWHLWKFLEKLPRVEILYHSVHYLDLIRSFLGEPRGIYAKTLKDLRSKKIASTRSAMLLDYGSLLRATVTVNHSHQFGQRYQESYIKWEGTRGMIKADLGLLLNYPKGGPDRFEYARLEKSKFVWRKLALKGSWFPDGFIGTMSSLMRYVEGSSHTLPTSTADAHRTMALVEAAYRSSEKGATPISK